MNLSTQTVHIPQFTNVDGWAGSCNVLYPKFVIIISRTTTGLGDSPPAIGAGRYSWQYLAGEYQTIL